MDKKFEDLWKSLLPSFHELTSMAPVKFSTLPKEMPKKGVYLFSEGDLHIYVGRSDGLRKRIQQHCRRGTPPAAAALASRRARRALDIGKASYKAENSRKVLALRPEFQQAFQAAKDSIGEMDIRWVEENDPVRQALLEIYVSVALETEENDFGNH
jgi:predicted GIY-YIG superfamily endonuclease